MPPREGAVIAVIPARGGSQGLPGKNVARVGGVPLIQRAVSAARAAARVDEVVVTTDDPDIAAAARAAGAVIVDRPRELSGAEASSESALLHALEWHGAHGGEKLGVVVFMQATSPFIVPEDVDRAVDRVLSGTSDVAFSAVESHAFFWRRSGRSLVGVNHDLARRPRRQDRPLEYRETGAFYAMDADGFARARHRFFGVVDAVEVDAATAIEIDDARDLELARALAPVLDDVRALPVKALVTDFDGVHTDDTAAVDEAGAESVNVSRADGFGLAALRDAGLPMLILSKERNSVVGARGRKLGIETRQAVDDKLAVLSQWAREQSVHLADLAYVGNDLNDLACLRAVGWPIAVPDAHPRVLAEVRLVLDRPGGRGALREVADLILPTLRKSNV